MIPDLESRMSRLLPSWHKNSYTAWATGPDTGLLRREDTGGRRPDRLGQVEVEPASPARRWASSPTRAVHATNRPLSARHRTQPAGHLVAVIPGMNRSSSTTLGLKLVHSDRAVSHREHTRTRAPETKQQRKAAGQLGQSSTSRIRDMLTS